MSDFNGASLLNSSSWTEKRQTKLLLVLAVFLVFAGIGLRSPWTPDEPRYVEVAREMVDSGQWLIPSRAGEYYPDKPPLFMWGIAISYKLLGNLKVAYLLPSAICSLLMLLLVFDLGRRLWDQRTALVAAFLLLMTPQFLMQARVAQIDAMVSFWITLGCYGLIRHFLLGPDWRYYFLSWAAMGFGIITKGVGFLPALMLLPLALVTKRDPVYMAGRWRWYGWAGPIVLLAAVSSWLAPMLWHVYQVGTPELEAYKNNILYRQTAERYAHSWHHIHPWYFFLVSIIPKVWFPLPLLLIAQWRNIKQSITKDSKILVLLAWVVLVLIFFSISPGKRSVYILPALPMLCLVLAGLWKNDLPSWFDRLLTVVLWCGSILVAVLALLILLQLPVLTKALDEYQSILSELSVLMLVTAVLALVILWFMRRKESMIRFGTLVSIFWVAVAFFANPLMDTVKTPRGVFTQIDSTIGSEGELAILNPNDAFSLYSTHVVTHFGQAASELEKEQNAWLWLKDNPKRFVLVDQDHEFSCFDLKKLIPVGAVYREDWYLLSDKSRRPDCSPPQKVQRFEMPKPHWQS